MEKYDKRSRLEEESENKIFSLFVQLPFPSVIFFLASQYSILMLPNVFDIVK